MKLPALLATPLLAGCAMTVQRPVVTTDAAEGLAEVTHSRTNEIDPAVSPDGREIAYASVTKDGAPSNVTVSSVSGRVVWASTGRDPTWMPDGSGIVFVGKDKLQQTFGLGVRPVFLADVGNTRLKPGTKPAISPDGKLVAMSLAPVGFRDSHWVRAKELDHGIALTDMLGSGTDVITAGAEPAFSPDGKHIAYVRTSEGHEHIFIANADGSNAVQITDGPADDQDPSWSPDGRRIVFCSAHGTDEWTQANLFTVKPDGSGMIQLTEGDRMACHPTWSKDGWVYFHANIDDRDHFHIWRIRVRDQGSS